MNTTAYSEKQGTHISTLQEKANQIRKEVIDIAVANGAGHIAPSLSCIDILVTLYYEVMERFERTDDDDRDRLVFSKAHGCYGLYAILADIGYIPRQHWTAFYKDSPLRGCIERNISQGIEAGCGSLGHGLPQAVGIAFGAKLQNKPYHVYCITGDGEMQEGSNWEALQFAAFHKLDNLTLIVDNNNLQAMESLRTVLSSGNVCEELVKKCTAFGCETSSCDGHSIADIITVLQSDAKQEKPRAVIAKTVKGYGLSCMENIPKFHFRVPTAQELNQGKRYE